MPELEEGNQSDCSEPDLSQDIFKDLEHDVNDKEIITIQSVNSSPQTSRVTSETQAVGSIAMGSVVNSSLL